MADKDLNELENEYHTFRSQFRGTLIVVLILLVVGGLFYHHTMHLDWVSTLYFCIITLTTVGYGDIVPTTDAERLFTVFYVLIGIGLLATFANLLIKRAYIKRELRTAKRKIKKENSSI